MPNGERIARYFHDLPKEQQLRVYESFFKAQTRKNQRRAPYWWRHALAFSFAGTGIGVYLALGGELRVAKALALLAATMFTVALTSYLLFRLSRPDIPKDWLPPQERIRPE